MAYKQYDPAILKKIQYYSGRVLKEFDRICQKLDITYFIYAGTAIGAVRHGGFIPWDDDVDVALPRDEYERFLKEAPSEMGSEFEIANGRISPGFPSYLTRFSLADSLWVPTEYEHCEHQFKIGIDIFAFDALPDNPKARKKKIRRAWLWGRLLYLKATARPHIVQQGLARALIYGACSVAHGALQLFRVPQSYLYGKWEEAALSYNDQPSERIADFGERDPEAWSISLDQIIPTRRIPFEDFEVQTANKDTVLLERGYGDFMQLPPEESRKNHFPSVLRFPDDTTANQID